jgi:hypothetical protein
LLVVVLLLSWDLTLTLGADFTVRGRPRLLHSELDLAPGSGRRVATVKHSSRLLSIGEFSAATQLSLSIQGDSKDIEEWKDVPAVSLNYEAARDALNTRSIRARVVFKKTGYRVAAAAQRLRGVAPAQRSTD